MEWIDIVKYFPDPLKHDPILALYMPLTDEGARIKDISQAYYLDNSLVILWWWYEVDAQKEKNYYWFVGQNPSIRFTSQNLKDYIGWWMPLPKGPDGN